MKQTLLYLLLFCTAACTGNHASRPQVKPKSTFWISHSLQPYILDSTTGERTIYGSGELLYIDEKRIMKSLSGDFYWQNDTLLKGGEPGITLKSGRWTSVDSGVVFTDILLHKTFRLPDDSIGKIERVSAKVIGDSIIIHLNDTLVPIAKLSADLKAFMNRNWTDFLN